MEESYSHFKSVVCVGKDLYFCLKLINMKKIDVAQHNRQIRFTAENRAGEMKAWPSPLEERMKVLLDDHDIFYETQKIFYIYDKGGKIIKYYIADFFVPDKNIIIEVDGKFHDKRKMYDKMRTRNIQNSYPDIEVLRYRWDDLSDKDKMNDLLWSLV